MGTAAGVPGDDSGSGMVAGEADRVPGFSTLGSTSSSGVRKPSVSPVGDAVRTGSSSWSTSDTSLPSEAAIATGASSLLTDLSMDGSAVRPLGNVDLVTGEP